VAIVTAPDVTAPDVTAPDVTAPDRGAIGGTIAAGRHIQASSVRETHRHEDHKGPGGFQAALGGLGSSS
jgi:hypothetical protein